MNDEELLELLRDMESQRAERKASVSDSSAIRRAICAFSNDLHDYRLPGVIFIGISDDGTCANTPITDELLRMLADMRANGHIEPFPLISVERKTLDGCTVAVITVHPASAPPVRCNTTAWVRVGPSIRAASEAELRALTEKRRSRDIPFEVRAVPGATTEDFDLGWFANEYLPSSVDEDELRRNERASETKLASVGFCTPPPECRPTMLGLLLCGLDPRSAIPGAYVQFLRIDGSELTDPIKDQKEIAGRIPQVLSELDDVLKAHIAVAADVTSGKTEIRSPEYPFSALQQLVRNAIMHRTYEATNAPVRILWYTGRIEISNPGGPFGQVTRENFGMPGVVDYRNPQLAGALKDLGFVQRFGLGIQLARKELAKNGNPPLEFEVETSHVLVTVRKRS
jgi:ATP-dependent DNA helicase RecG